MEHEHEAASKDGSPRDVQVEEVSPSYLRVTIEGITFDIGVERVYMSHAVFGEFRSIDELIEVLTAVRKQAPLEALQMHMHGHDRPHGHETDDAGHDSHEAGHEGHEH